MGISYGTGAANTGILNFILLSGTTASSTIFNISGNKFTNLSLKASSINLINTSNKLSASGRRIIDNNKITGTLTVAANSGSLCMIRSEGDPAAGSIASVTNNDFSNVTVTATSNFSYTGHLDNETNAAANGYSTKKIRGNTYANWSGGIGNQAIMALGNFGSVAASASPVDSVANNVVTNITTTNGAIAGLRLGSILTGQTGASIANTISVKGNTISSLATLGTTGSIDGLSIGIDIAIADRVRIEHNKMYDLQAAAADATVNGIKNSLEARVDMYNNMIADLRTPSAGNATAPSVSGIMFSTISALLTPVYNNTIYLNASSSSSLFSSAAVYSFTGNRYFQNNLFINISSQGASGKTVAFWKSSPILSDYDNLSNYNLFYAGVPSAQKLIFYDGTNSDQTLAAFKTRVGPARDAASISSIPVFLSTAGANPNFLHLDPFNNCGIIGEGNNDNNLLQDDIDGDGRTIAPPSGATVDIGADEVAKSNTWTGNNNTSWNDAGNWSMGTVPNATDRHVSITATPINQPVIDAGETFQVRNLLVASGASLINKGTLKVAGKVIASAGTINNINSGVVTGSIEMNTLCFKTMSIKGNVFAGNAVKDFRIFSDFSVSSATGEGLKVSGLFGFGVDAATVNKTFNSGNNVVLVSTADATASVVKTLSNNIYTGEFTVERFIPARRSWRLLTAPLISTSTTTISQAWQDGQQATTIPPPVYTAGSGSLITFSTTAVNGYDKGSTANPSLKFYNGTGWAAPANTTMPLKTHPGYMLFVRGDRNISIAGTGVVPNATTLRPKGEIGQYVNYYPGTTGFNIVGNPFPSAINFHTIQRTAGIADQYRLWDPKIGGIAGVGGFVTFAWNSLNNNYDRTVTGAGSSVLPQDGTIESGAAFVVNFSTNGTLTITELDKVSTSASAPFGRPTSPSAAEGRLRANLGFYETDGSFQLLDGVLLTFHSSYKNELDAGDAVKMTNINEDFGININDTAVAIERRELIKQNDTVFFKFSQPKLRTYILQLAPLQLAAPGLTAFIEDKYTNTQTQVSLTDTSYYSFATSNSAAGSYAPDRIQLIFKTTSIDSVTPAFLQLAATQQNNFIAVDWKINNEQFVEKYEIEKSINGIDFIKVASIDSDGNGLYQWLDEQADEGNNFYRIKKIGTNGEFEYSSIVNARIGKTKNWVNVYPNPATGGNCIVQVNNKSAGVYTLRLLSSLGQVMYSSTFSHPGRQSSQQLKLPGNITDGEYQVELICIANGHSDIIPLLIKRK